MTAPAPHRESELEAFFAKRVKLLGGAAIKLAPINPGVPDRLVLMPPGTLHLVELKTEVGLLSPIQRHWHDQAAKIGIHVDTLHGKADIVNWLRERIDAAESNLQPSQYRLDTCLRERRNLEHTLEALRDLDIPGTLRRKISSAERGVVADKAEALLS